MKLNGETLKVLGEAVVVIPRPGNDIVFKAIAVTDEEPFIKLFPQPTPPVNEYPNGDKILNVEDETYVAALDVWANAKTDWLVLQSLKLGSPEVTWDTVDMADHTTWRNYQTELKDAGFSEMEIMRIIGCVISANGLDQDKIDRATKSFLAERAASLKG